MKPSASLELHRSMTPADQRQTSRNETSATRRKRKLKLVPVLRDRHERARRLLEDHLLAAVQVDRRSEHDRSQILRWVERFHYSERRAHVVDDLLRRVVGEL